MPFERIANITNKIKIANGINANTIIKKIAEIDAPFSKSTFRFNAGENGRHELIIAVNNEFDDSNSSMWRRDYDFYAHGGIYRKLTIKTAEAIYEREIKILTADIDCGKVDIDTAVLFNIGLTLFNIR